MPQLQLRHKKERSQAVLCSDAIKGNSRFLGSKPVLVAYTHGLWLNVL